MWSSFHDYCLQKKTIKMSLFRKGSPKSKFYYLVVVILFTLPVGLLIVGAISLTDANHRSSMITMSF